jgi:hypothetical protein
LRVEAGGVSGYRRQVGQGQAVPAVADPPPHRVGRAEPGLGDAVAGRGGHDDLAEVDPGQAPVQVRLAGGAG